MDIYRFFHPHHNPRLLYMPLRQQEVSELEQAAAELLKALHRAQQRTTKRAVGPILPQHFSDIIKAMQFAVRSLQTLCDAHPGDTVEELKELIKERADAPGWDTWRALIQEQMTLSSPSDHKKETDQELAA